MARCTHCNKFMLFPSKSGYCNDCSIAMYQEETRRKAEKERKRQEEEAQRKAEEERKRQEEEEQRVKEIRSKYKKGNIVYWGRYNSYDPIKWHLVDIQGTKGMLISDRILDFSVYHHTSMPPITN